MNPKKTFKKIFENKNEITAAHADELRVLINKYPYCQILRFFYVKSLKDKDIYLFKTNLSLASIYTKDREVLFYFIKDMQKNTVPKNSNEFEKNPVQKDKMTSSPLVEKEKIVSLLKNKTITNGEKSKADKTTDVTPIDYPILLEEKLRINNPDNNTTKMSFEEWLDHMDKNKQPKKTSKSNISNLPNDKVLVEGSKLNKHSNPPKVNLAKKRNLEKLDFMTETLAKTYVEQHKYDNAIEAYEVLILKNPKKSNYFASKITSIKDLKKQKT